MCQSFYKKIYLLNSRIGDVFLTVLRNKETNTKEFQKAMKQIGLLLASEIGKNIKVKEKKVETPIASTNGSTLEQKIILVPVLRAALGLLPGFLHIFEKASVGTVGFKRTEGKKIKSLEYEWKLPKINKDDLVIILDPMIATGTTAIEVLKKMKQKQMAKIIFVSVIGSVEGLEKVSQVFPEVEIWTVAVDKKLNSKKFIVPGLGDAGDRFFGTK